jgi:hypothetical protein
MTIMNNPGPRLRVLPILLTLFIGLAILAVSFTLAIIILRHVDAQLIPRLWPLLTIAEVFEFGFALLGIAVARRFLKDAMFGIRWPPGGTLVGLAVVWGVLFGIIMLIVDHSGDLMRGITPGTRAHAAVDNAGWQWLITIERSSSIRITPVPTKTVGMSSL